MSNQKYPKSEADRTASFKGEAAYVSWDGTQSEQVAAFAQFTEAIDEFVGVSKDQARGRWNQDLSDLSGNTSGRPGLSKRDYYAFRPEEAPSKSHKGMIADADFAYQSVGLVKNIIDLMADFACQGIRLVHPNKRIEKFYQNWFTRVEGKDRSERFLNNLYRTGNIVIRKQTARIKLKDQQALYKAKAEPETQILQQVVKKNEIPWKYTFLNPLLVDVVGGPLAAFVGEPVYGIRLPRTLARLIKNPKTPEEKALVAQLPKEVILAAETNKMVALPADKTSVFHYKKDDWQSWAHPMIHAIMDDITVLEKLRLADMAALDGAISNIRIFKIGNLEHKLVPTKVAAAKLASILQNNVGGGTMDLIWGPDIELVESKTSVHQFLGEDKYKPHLNAIYAGLGIPPTLTGTFGAAGTTNNLVSLKTLTGRLEYGRDILRQFWEKEIAEVQKAMGFRFPAKIEFRTPNLGDEASDKALLVQLADRSLISDEMLQHLFGNDPELERIRINRETRERAEGKMIPKAGAFHDPQFGDALKKVALTTGVVTPAQVGLRKDAKLRDMKMYPPETGEKPALLMKQPPAGTGGGGGKTAKKPGVSGQGRPKNKKDSTKRKTKTFKPKTKAVLEIWAKEAQTAISEYLKPFFLDMFEKPNMRSLSQDQTHQAEKIKFGVLCNIEPLGVLDEKAVVDALNHSTPTNIYKSYCDWIEEVSVEIDRKLTLEELKHVQASVYASHMGE